MCVISWLAPERCGSDSIENILQIKFMSTSVEIALISTRQHWLRELLGVVRQQALTRVTVDPAPYGIIRSWWVKVQCHSPMTFISDLFWTEHSSIKSMSCDKKWAIWANGTGKWILHNIWIGDDFFTEWLYIIRTLPYCNQYNRNHTMVIIGILCSVKYPKVPTAVYVFYTLGWSQKE